jgi:pyridoxine 5-phosphate synthase
MPNDLRLGVNIDHVATIRNARGGFHPDPIRAAKMAEKAGADGITAHLREDRRHISDRDIELLIEQINVPLNLEMSATDEMLAIALKTRPHAACIVPEKRQELTTEGGLDVVEGEKRLGHYIEKLKKAGIRVSLFIDADHAQVEAAHRLGADIVEFHTGTFCEVSGIQREQELKRIISAVDCAYEKGIECHAGHGLSFDTVAPIAAIKKIKELNIVGMTDGELPLGRI